MPGSPRRRRAEIAETLRRRVVSAVGAGSLRRGDRLPSAREVAAEFDADPRLVLAAYRILATEGVVDIRRRSGIYVAATPEVAGGPAVVAEGWLVDVLQQGIEHGISAARLGEWLKRCMTTKRLRAAVVADTADQIESYCGELREDYGIDPVPFAPDAIDRPGGLPPEMLAADVVIAAEPHASVLRAALAPAGKRVITATIRSEIDAAWRRLLDRGVVHFVVGDPRTVDLLRSVTREHVSSIEVHVVGRDDVRLIPPSAPVYVTRAARRRLGSVPVPGRLIPASRVFTAATMRDLLMLVVEVNLRAMKGG